MFTIAHDTPSEAEVLPIAYSLARSAITIPKTVYTPDSGFHPNSDNPEYPETLAIPPSRAAEPAFLRQCAHNQPHYYDSEIG